MHVRFTQINERVPAASGYLLLPKAVTSAVSVIMFKVEPLQTMYEE